MAPIVSESKRVREVRKYYTRGSDDVPIAGEPQTFGQDGIELTKGLTTTAVTSPNKTLTALMQLIACRLNMERAMVSVVDENAQYFLAESTKSLDLVDPLQHDEGDALWMGCGGTARSEALCANTIKLPYQEKSYACFSVSNLAEHPSFCNLPYVAGPPYFKFYAGTPLLTRENVPIGSVFVIDTRPRGPPTKFEIDILGVMAKNVMEYLEMRRESEMRKRNQVMSKGLSSLVDGKFSIIPSEAQKATPEESSQPQVIASSHAPDTRESLDEVKTAPASNGQKDDFTDTPLQNSECSSKSLIKIEGLEGSRGSSRMQMKSRPKEADDIPTQEQILFRAANLLRESLDVDYALFLDVLDDFTASSTSSEAHEFAPSKSETLGTSTFEVANGAITPPEEQQQDVFWRQGKVKPSQSGSSAASSEGKEVSAKIISFSSESLSTIDCSDLTPKFGFRSPECKQLRRLLRRYPEGKLWSLDDNGAESSDDEQAQDVSREGRLSETTFLMQSFPGARQVIYAPLFNVEKSIHVAACFCVMLEATPIFTNELEVAFLRAFMNSVSVACNRSSMATANRLKADFISSISHELRSPLHGILASVELLSSSSLDRLQNEYCGTISTCGQALLETITGILEYTKINTLKRGARDSTRSKTKRPALVLENANKSVVNRPTPDLLASSIVDIGRVCEDSCLLVAAAYAHHTSTPDQPLYRVFIPPDAAQQLNIESALTPARVTVVLDISPGDWRLVALPGALQRIVMNLVGNSLKYTAAGFVKVELAVHPNAGTTESRRGSETGDNIAMVELNVIDSGRGISNEFLKTKLFSAFEQETILAPGTGLGLHLVKSLVQMHSGSIDIKSEVGKGTHVTVKLPLELASDDCDATDSNLDLGRKEPRDSMSELLCNKKPKSFLLFGFTDSTSTYLKKSLDLYLKEWFKMSPAEGSSEAAIVITDEVNLADCLSHIARYARRPKVIVVCDQIRQKHFMENQTGTLKAAELLTIPFGPYKLSKTILTCLEAEEQPEEPISSINGFHIPNPDAVTFANVGMLSPPALIESPYSSSGDSFPWYGPATPIPNAMQNVRELPTPVMGATLPSSSLSLRPPPSAPSPCDKAVDTTTKPLANEKKPRILCVDDNSINLRLLKTFMEKLHFTNVTCAENGSLAFEAVRCQKESFDLIFMDLSMPVCDGFQAISLIRTLEKINQDISPPNVPKPKSALIVALTGLASQRDQDTARHAGADHYITKPMKLSRLKVLLKEWNIVAEEGDGN